MRIWEFTSYRPYLVERLGAEGSRTGLRKKLAEAISVHATFVSQVLKEKADFSLEQAEAINGFFEHTEDEGEYFILLILKDRAGADKLRARFARKIKAVRENRLNIRKRLEVDAEISEKDRERFYSTYIYGAIHVLTSLPGFNSIDALAQAVKLSRARTKEAVDFLLRIGVVKESGGKLGPGPSHVHLGNQSEIILKHHSNWRMHALSELQFLDREDVHYSACLSLSRADVFRVKESILQNLKANVGLIEKSKEETAYVMNVDFYKLVD